MAPTVHAQATEKDAFVGDLQTVVKEKKYDAIACNCWAYIRSLYPSFPTTDKITTDAPLAVGNIAVFDYPHYALITKLDETGFWIQDANFKRCKYMTHHISFFDKHLLGYYAIKSGAKVD